jgi:hypothetical protein
MCKEYIVEIPKEKNNNYRLSGSWKILYTRE